MADTTPAVAAPVDASAAAPAADAHTYKFNISMSCGGCSGAVDRVLKKLGGVKSHTVSLEDQTATVVAEPSLEYETVLRTIAKTGKKVNSGEADGEARSVDLE